MLHNVYDNYNYSGFTIYKSLHDFINGKKQYYISKRQQKIDKINGLQWVDNNFNDIFNDFIICYLYDWNIGKYENVTIIKYDDTIVIFTKDKKYQYVFYD